MASTATPQGTVRQRSVPGAKKTKDGASSDVEIDKLVKAAAKPHKAASERDHWAAFTLVTVLSFLTRFWGISHPNEVVFDEVHFGKVSMPWLESTISLLTRVHSSLHTTYNGRISSMSILPLENSSSL